MATDAATSRRKAIVTSPDRVLWPAVGFTKGGMIDYYTAIAPVLLPHLAGAPVTLRRFPEGVDGPGWYQTECRNAPAWVATTEVRGERGAGQRYCRIESVDALIWAANIGSIEFHPLAVRVDRPHEAAMLILDLDPGPPASIVDCCSVALELRSMLVEMGVASPVVKTSGSLGLHLVVPLGPGHSFDAVKATARRMGDALARRRPDLVTDRATRAERRGRVFVDWIANDSIRSIVAPYSLRALRWPLVSTPLRWEEVEAAVAGHDPRLLWFGPRAVLERVDRDGDLFAGALGRPQVLGVLPEVREEA